MAWNGFFFWRKNALYQGINQATDEFLFAHLFVMLFDVIVWYFFIYTGGTEEKWLNDLQMNKYHHINSISGERKKEKKWIWMKKNRAIIYFKRRVVFFSLSLRLSRKRSVKKRERESINITGNKGKIQIFQHFFFFFFGIGRKWCEIFGCRKTIKAHGVRTIEINTGQNVARTQSNSSGINNKCGQSLCTAHECIDD